MNTKVLAVDDSLTMREMVSHYLTEANFDVVTAVDGADGIEKLNESLGLEIPEGYLPVYVPGDDKQIMKRDILYPTNPGSVYHMTKSMDQLLFQFYAKNDQLRITDLHQGIVWGTQTEETRLDDRLINRFNIPDP